MGRYLWGFTFGSWTFEAGTFGAWDIWGSTFVKEIDKNDVYKRFRLKKSSPKCPNPKCPKPKCSSPKCLSPKSIAPNVQASNVGPQMSQTQRYRPNVASPKVQLITHQSRKAEKILILPFMIHILTKCKKNFYF